MQTQVKDLINYLSSKGNSITQLQALSKFGIMRLASRIYDLRKRGYNIETNLIAVRVRNKFGKKALVAQYRFIV